MLIRDVVLVVCCLLDVIMADVVIMTVPSKIPEITKQVSPKMCQAKTLFTELKMGRRPNLMQFTLH